MKRIFGNPLLKNSVRNLINQSNAANKEMSIDWCMDSQGNIKITQPRVGSASAHTIKKGNCQQQFGRDSKDLVNIHSHPVERFVNKKGTSYGIPLDIEFSSQDINSFFFDARVKHNKQKSTDTIQTKGKRYCIAGLTVNPKSDKHRMVMKCVEDNDLVDLAKQHNYDFDVLFKSIRKNKRQIDNITYTEGFDVDRR